TKYVYILGNDERSCIQPWRIKCIRGLPHGDVVCPPAPEPDPLIQACIIRLEKISKLLRLAQLKFSRTSNLIDAQVEMVSAMHAIEESLSDSISSCQRFAPQIGAGAENNGGLRLGNETNQEGASRLPELKHQ